MAKRKEVTCKTNVPTLNARKGQRCTVLKESFHNGESWYLLEDTETKIRFESPSVFWA